MPEIHYKKSPSAAHRWLNCPGSLTFQAPDTFGTAAAEGTRAHGLAEWMAAQALGLTNKLPEALGDYPEEMIDAAKSYSTFVARRYVEAGDDAVVYLEKTFKSSTVEDFGGTGDCIMVHGNGLIAEIIDFKYGFGVVTAERNEQLMCYAAILLEQHPDRQPFSTP